MFKIVNLTDKPLYLRNSDDVLIQIAPSGAVARVMDTEPPVVAGLPEPAPRTIFVVSEEVVQLRGDRRDVYAPAAPVKNEAGEVVGWEGLD